LQLKKLQLLGFKTFADKTEIVIDSGLTAIVGPNGSGKSNIVDALLWVLGEQNPRLMRGNSTIDVIFAGTDKRKPLGMAEVRLTIDNSDGTLPIQFGEVTVTRRIYRSGESQYMLNGAPCRLKDIVELFLDTGVGKGAYAFVSQSEIDAVLSARPEDRRELFEEAAGIKKYRFKKREAMRKLESAETNLHRVGDILHELDAQREPMERQAQTARRFILLQERLHEIEVGLLVAEVQKADYELYAGKTERDEDQANLLKFDAELARLERASAEVGENLAHTEGEMEAAQITRQNAVTMVERMQSRLALMTERSQTSVKNQEQFTAELRELADRVGRLTDSIALDRQDRDEVDAEERLRQEEWSAQKATLGELETAVQQAVRQADARQGERSRRLQERAARQAALKAAQERLTELTARSERMTRDALVLAETLTEAQSREEQSRVRQEELAGIRGQLTGQRAQVEARQQAAQSQQVAGRTALDTARRTHAEQSARLSTLTELQESHEGFYQGVRAVLNAEKRGQLQGHFRAVVDLLQVPEPYRVAIEVALGGSLQDIVTQTEAEAKAGIQWLKQNRAGRATFLPLPLLRSGNRFDPDAGRGTANAVQNALELVTFASEYLPVAQMLLGRVLVVPDMEAAIAASRRVGNGWSKIVTLEGELLTPSGALTGGSLQGKGAHLVGRKGEMDDLKSALPQTKAEVDRLTGQSEEVTRTLQELELERRHVVQQEGTVQAELAATESARAAAERERLRLTREQTEREAGREAVATQRHNLTGEVGHLTTTLETDRVEEDNADEMMATLTEQTRSLVARRDACRLRAIALEVEVSRLKEKCEGLTRSLGADIAALKAVEHQIGQKRGQQEQAHLSGEDAAAELQRLTHLREEAQRNLATAEHEYTQWKDRRQGMLAQNFETNSGIKEVARRRGDVTRNLHETELRLARLEMQMIQATERLRDEYSIGKEDALARPENTTIDRNTAMEVGRLRRELRGMGQVNTGAVGEYDRLTERLEFLITQRADLEKGRESLLATIAEIDDSTRGVFMETFEAVRIEFDRLFTQLFDGGTTKLVLTNPEDILETGIEVIAQPPGKKPQHLSLLSGGERALTATALLFAFLAVKPSPFVLLDEVDAPLDGANVEKFTRLVAEFSQRSQFLLITHNPTTMEAAPTWYGVTMREPGISSILSYRVPQEATVSEAEQAVVLTTKEPSHAGA
jgi:chromosome segregation protein